MSIKVAAPKNEFQAAALVLDNAADALAKASKNSLEEAGKSVKRAGQEGAKALGHLDGAAMNAVFALGHTGLAGLAALDGVAYDAEAAMRAGAGAAIGAVATGGWAIEGMATGARFVLLNMAKGFVALANAIDRGLLGNAGTNALVVKSLGDPNAKRLSERLFDAAGDQFKLSGEALSFGWDAYADAARELAKAGGHVAGSITNVGYFAMHTGAMAGNLGLAALQAAAPLPLKAAELAVRVAKVGVEFAEKGVEGARDLALLSAELTAAAGNALAQPDQAKYQISEKTIADFEKRFNAIKAAA
ncbi:MAG: hypothetical protein HY903_20720 [Deltaproteobacteria bacterium]|nr:hypothetical protein [Deltaproteobacteria bacterium]